MKLKRIVVLRYAGNINFTKSFINFGVGISRLISADFFDICVNISYNVRVLHT